MAHPAGSVPGIPSKEADAQMLANLMQIEQFMAASRKQEKPVHVVTNIKHPETVQVTSCTSQALSDCRVTTTCCEVVCPAHLACLKGAAAFD